MKQRIYLDNNATTQVDPRVIDEITKDLQTNLGNPSSIHSFGKEARNRLNKARQTIAEFLRVKPNEIIFTSGGTEGINMVIRGTLDQEPSSAHVISSDQEHSSVFHTIKAMEAKGCQTTILSPGLWGAVKANDLQDAIRPDTRLIALTAVNNETGVKTDINEIALIAKERRIPLLIDGVALMGKEIFDIPEGVSAMCFSGHKFHAPKGTGFIYLRHSLKLQPMITGGDQEFQKRAGTENISGIIGLACAVSLLKNELPCATSKMCGLRDRLEKGIIANLPFVSINGHGPRIANITNLAFEGVDGESLLTCLDIEGIAVSHGSACASGALEPSRILLNMGLSLKLARSSLRFSLSRFTTEQEIDRCIDIVTHVARRLRKIVEK